MKRDIPFERHATRIAAYGAHGLDIAEGLDAAATLTAFAESRTRPGPVDAEGRDFIREIAEEVADARNYAAWHLLAMRPDADRVRLAFAHIVAAWAALGFDPPEGETIDPAAVEAKRASDRDRTLDIRPCPSGGCIHR